MTTTSERIEAFLAHATIVDALREDQSDGFDIVALLSDVASLSEQYIPTLQFLMRPNNRTSEDASLGLAKGTRRHLVYGLLARSDRCAALTLTACPHSHSARPVHSTRAI